MYIYDYVVRIDHFCEDILRTLYGLCDLLNNNSEYLLSKYVCTAQHVNSSDF